MANLWWVHNDPKIWGDPDQFRPERHLDEDGRFVKSRYVIPFAVGPRRCLGELLARDLCFLFWAFFLQKFTFESDPLSGIPTMEKDPRSMVDGPFHFMVRIKPRDWKHIIGFLPSINCETCSCTSSLVSACQTSLLIVAWQTSLLIVAWRTSSLLIVVWRTSLLIVAWLTSLFIVAWRTSLLIVAWRTSLLTVAWRTLLFIDGVK